MKIKVFTVCSGYDSQCMALDMLKKEFDSFDYELVGWSEIDPHAIELHNLFYPQWVDRNFGDVTKIDWTNVPDFDLFTYSTPCFVKGTMVLTSNGYKPIEDVEVGDMVLTHTNEYKMVTETMQHPSNDLFKINAMMFDELVCTGNHPFYVRKKVRKGHLGQRHFCPPEWIEAKSLNKDYYLSYAINTDNKLPQWDGHDNTTNSISTMIESPSFWYVMGRYVGDGYRMGVLRKCIVINCSNQNKQSLIDALDVLGINYSIIESKICCGVYIYDNEWHRFTQRYDTFNNKVDADTIALPSHLLEHFIFGMVDSIGCKVGELTKVKCASKELVYGLAQCVAKVYHRPLSVKKTTKKKINKFDGRVVYQYDEYTIAWKECDDEEDKAFYEDGVMWYPINSIEPLNEKQIVYNMEVVDDHTYTANGAIVHNCQDISTAGQQRGIAEGSGTRSSILWECKRAITIKRPKVLLMENVKALVGKKFRPYFDKWLEFLSSQGYSNYWQVISPQGICICLCASMELGGGYVPYIIVKYENSKNRKLNQPPTK